MELTLNLFWLLLTIPALWLWWQARFARVRGRQVRPSAMVLGCLLLLLLTPVALLLLSIAHWIASPWSVRSDVTPLRKL